MKTIQTEKYLILVDETIQPVNGYYYDTFIDKIRNTNSAEYGKSEITLQIIAASPKLGDLPEFQTLPPNTEDDVETSIRKVIGEEYYKAINKDGSQFNLLKAVYKQAKSETMFSEKIYNTAIQVVGDNKIQTLRQFLQSLTKPKEYEFIVEEERLPFIVNKSKRKNPLNGFEYAPKIINNKIQGTWKLKTN